MGSESRYQSAMGKQPVQGAPAAQLLRGEVRGVQLFSDGSVVRTDKPLWPDMPADPALGSKDVVLDEATGVWARLFLPPASLSSSSSADAAAAPGILPEDQKKKKKLPVLVYFHGGGFVAFQPSSSIFHNLCSSISRKFGLLVISVAYRLAPEHKLPIAFEDSFLALRWIQQQAIIHDAAAALQAAAGESSSPPGEPWMEYADVANCFLMGGSAGGTIVHYMAARANEYDLSPLKLKGLFPVVPFFGGEARSESEIRSATQPCGDPLTLQDTDTFWSFSLPEGASRDHPFCRCPAPEDIAGLEYFPPSMVVVGAKDVLHSRQIEYVEALKKAGKDARLVEYKGIGHMLLFPDVQDHMEYSHNKMATFMEECISL